MNNIKDFKNIKPNLIMDVVSCDIAKLQIDEIGSTLIVKAKVSPDSAFSQIEIYDDNDDVEVAEIIKVGMYTIDVAGYNVIKLECGNDIKGVISLKTENVINGQSGEGGESIIVDSFLSDTSTNPVQNKVITAGIKQQSQELVDYSVYYGRSILPSPLSYFNLSEDGTEIKSVKTEYRNNTMLVIPCKNNEKNIISIGENAFQGCLSKIIIIPNTITIIKKNAFNSCVALSELSLPESITTIEDNAFEGCSLLKKMNIPDSVVSLGINVFKDCGKLQIVVIGNGILELSNLFVNCSVLRKIYISKQVEIITNLLENCYSGATIYCEQGSYVAEYAKENNVPYKYTDIDPNSSGGSVDVDDHLSATSTNPVQNRVITEALNAKQDVLTETEFSNLLANSLEVSVIDGGNSDE